MRLNLENNMHFINLNFKRFYEEADIARKIVGEQLKEVSKKEQELNAKADKLSMLSREESYGYSYKRQTTNKITEEENLGDLINQVNSDNNLKHSFPHELLKTNN